eukprot:6156866-Prymnesium_polylepis.1
MRAALRLRPLARPKQAMQVEVARGPARPTLADRGCRQRREASERQKHPEYDGVMQAETPLRAGFGSKVFLHCEQVVGVSSMHTVAPAAAYMSNSEI